MREWGIDSLSERQFPSEIKAAFGWPRSAPREVRFLALDMLARLMRFGMVLVLGSGWYGCALPKAGDPCGSTGFFCADQTTALECKLGAWRELPCRGPTGCHRFGSQVNCDMRGNLVGDSCAASAEGYALCNATGDGTLECRLGELIPGNPCKACSVFGSRVLCQP